VTKPKEAKKSPVTATQFLFGFKDQSGHVVIPAQFESVGKFSGNHAPASKNKKWGIIDQKGAWTCEPKFEFISRVENGFAVIRLARLFGLVQLDGAEILAPKFDEIVSVGAKAVIVKTADQFSVLDFKGKVLIDTLEYASKWSEGFVAVASKGLAGLLDEEGKWLVKPVYDAIYDFSEGMAAFDKDGKSGYFDLKGKVAIAPVYDAAYDFSEGLARVRKNDKFGYIDQSGKLIIPCQWDEKPKVYADETDEPTRFHSGFAQVSRILNENEDDIETGYIDRKGKWHDALPKSAETKPKTSTLESFREQTTAWEKAQEEVDLGPEFDKQLDAYSKKLAKAMGQDQEKVIKALKEIMAEPYDKSVKFLDLMITNLQESIDLVVYPNGGDIGDQTDPRVFKPFKAVSKANNNDGIAEPRSKKGVDRLEKFREECAERLLQWIADLWKQAGGSKFKIKSYLREEDADTYIDLKTGKRVNQDDLG
jgi:hypothetical protein